MIFTSGKVKTRTYNRLDQLLAELPLYYNFYKRKSESMYMQPAWLAAGTAVPALPFLQAEKQKHICITGLTS